MPYWALPPLLRVLEPRALGRQRVLPAGEHGRGEHTAAQLRKCLAGGGKVEPAPEPEVGWFAVELTEAASDDPVFSALPHRFDAFQWHEYAAGVPPGAVELARNRVCPQAFRTGEAAWGVQFHPEVGFEQLVRWINAYADPPVPPDRYIAAAREHIAEWNDIGRTICERFFAVASGR